MNNNTYRTLIGGDYAIDYLVLSKLPVDDILHLYNYGGYFAPICADDYFWYLVATHHFPRVISSSGTSWFQLIKFLTSPRVKDVNEGLRLSTYMGNISLIEYFITKGSKAQEAKDWDGGMFGAAWSGNKHLVELFISKGADFWDWGMIGATYGGHKELVDFFISKGVNYWDWNRGIYDAARGGHKNLIDFFITKGGNYWNGGLYGAAYGGHKDLVDFFISKGANDLNRGMEEAIRGGHKDLTQYFVTKGAKYWYWGMFRFNRGIYGAAYGGHKDFFINDLNPAREDCIPVGHKNLIEYFITKGAKYWGMFNRIFY